MEIFVFKSNVNSQSELKKLLGLFSKEKEIDEWSVDFEDTDKVLRIVAKKGMTKKKVIEMVNSVGHQCQELED